jgi:hypothetical protein
LNEQQQKLAEKDQDVEANIRRNEGTPQKFYAVNTISGQQESPISNQKLLFNA